MPVSLHSQIGDKPQADQALMDAISAGMRVSIPGIIQSFDADAVTCVIQPVVKGYVPTSDGAANPSNLPLLLDVPVIFPRGGGVTLTFPVKAGDECLVVFADRCIDFWHQNGGIQEAATERMHHLADATAQVGLQSQAQKISGISTTTAQLRTDDGAAFIELDPGSHEVNVVTSGKLTATAEETTVNGPVIFNGPVTFNSSVTQSEGKGDASFGGNVTAKGDITASNISVKNHTHGGVETGGGQTGGPQ